MKLLQRRNKQAFTLICSNDELFKLFVLHEEFLCFEGTVFQFASCFLNQSK
jgi:hypothetical protein